MKQAQAPDHKRMIFDIYNLAEDYVSKRRNHKFGNALSEIVRRHGYSLHDIYQEMSEAEWKENQKKVKTNFYANSKIDARIEKLSEKENSIGISTQFEWRKMSKKEYDDAMIMAIAMHLKPIKGNRNLLQTE